MKFNIKYILKFFSKYKIPVLFILIIIIILRIINSIYIFNNKYKENNIPLNMYVTVLNKERISEDYISYKVSLKYNDRYSDKFLLYIYKDKKIYNEKDNEFLNKYNTYEYGDILEIKGRLTYPNKLNNLNEFDYKLYLNSKDIVSTIMTYDSIKVSETGFNIIKLINEFKDNVENKINKIFPSKHGNLLKSMIYGNDLELDEDIKNNFKDLGLSHLIAVSGSNVGIVLILLKHILKKLKVKNIIIPSVLFVYLFCILCDFEISVIRSSLMIGIALIIPTKINKFILLGITGIILIIINPFVIFNVSFILSFISTFGIILLNNRIFSFFNKFIVKLFKLRKIIDFKNKKSKIKLLYKLVVSLSSILSIYFSVQIILFPIQIYFFGSFNIISMFSNIIINIFSSFELIIGAIFVITCFIPILNSIISYLNYINLSCIINITDKLNSINFSEINFIKPNIICIILYYLIIILLIFKDELFILFKYKLNIKINIKLYKKINLGLIIVSFIYIITFNIYTEYFLNFIYYFNVEQGNMAVIKQGRTTILIDMGTTGNINLSSILVNFLKAYNINKIDYFLITHFHKDHISGLLDLEEYISSNQFKIETVIYTYDKNENKTNNTFGEKNISYNDFSRYIDKYRIKQITAERFDCYEINKDITIDILNPLDNKIIKSSDITNSNSLITCISINNKNFLFMGDATLESEKIMIDDMNDEYYFNKLNDITAAQIGHHGSNTSTSELLLKNIRVKEAIISSKKKVYNHPSDLVVNRLMKYNIKVHVTENHGGKLIII